jgi:hypothetical protein
LEFKVEEIQEISVTNNQKKAIITALKRRKSAYMVDENGDLMVEIEAYEDFMDEFDRSPIEDLLGDDVLDYTQEFWVFIS